MYRLPYTILHPVLQMCNFLPNSSCPMMSIVMTRKQLGSYAARLFTTDDDEVPENQETHHVIAIYPIPSYYGESQVPQELGFSAELL